MRLSTEPNAHGYYEIRWTETRDGKPRSMRKSTKTGDREKAMRFMERFKAGESEDRPRTVAEVAEFYIEGHAVPRGQHRGETARLKPVSEIIGDVIATDITDEDIEKFIRRRRAEGLADASTRRSIVALQAALNYASRKTYIPGRQTFRLPKPDDAPPRDLWMSETQEQQMLLAVQQESLSVQLFVRMALTYGVRKGAMEDLRWEQVDMERGMIAFHRPGARKTRKRRPTVPMTEEIRLLLMKRRLQTNGDTVLERATDREYAKFAKRIGLAWVTPHILKHTAVTLMLRGGADLMSVAKLTATDPRTLMQTYRHHCRDELLATARCRA